MAHLVFTFFDLSRKNYISKVYSVFVGKLGFFTKNSAKLVSHFSDFLRFSKQLGENGIGIKNLFTEPP
jgi:hypothetical protein